MGQILMEMLFIFFGNQSLVISAVKRGPNFAITVTVTAGNSAGEISCCLSLFDRSYCMGAQPKPPPGVASLAREDLTSRATVMLTLIVCS